MKIVFLCSSLEPGCDGVGDYSRRLAGALILLGHPTLLLAINDQFIRDKINGSQLEDNITIPVFRLPSNWTASRRFSEAKRWIDEQNPEWISLQYVPFSFHSKGLHFGLSKRLLLLGKGRHWHIMFHELWVGMNVEADGKLVWWGRFQKLMIKSLIKTIKPKVINTQTSIYLEQLKAMGFKGHHLPLFTNIPLIHEKPPFSFNKLNSVKPTNKIDLVLFGSIFPGVPADAFFKEIAQVSRLKKIQFSMTIIGRTGKEKEHWANICRIEGLTVNLLDEQEPESISHVLSNASIGISTTPVALAEKSGSIAAMSRHGLPVICVSKSWRAKGLENISPLHGVFEYRKGSLEKYFTANRLPAESYEVTEISARFARTLLASNSN